mgnify:FL=1
MDDQPTIGRPTLFRDEFVEQARKLALLGATDREVADFFDVSERTVNDWKLRHPEFLQSLKSGKEAADERVERSLYHRALGYSHDSVKMFQAGGAVISEPYDEHYPPDTTAAIFWLKNRWPKEWRDKTEQAVEMNANHNHSLSPATQQILDGVTGRREEAGAPVSGEN